LSGYNKDIMIDFSKAIDLTDVPQNEWREKYIGDGYRYCCYRTILDDSIGENGGESHRQRDWRNGEGEIGQIILFGYDKNNNPQTFICPWRSHIAHNVGYKTENKDIFGRYVQYKWFENSRQRKSYAEKMDKKLIVECLPPQNEFLHAMFDEVALDENFNKQKKRTFYLDIETEISDSGFEGAETARNRINMITIYDTLTEKYYTWGLNDANIEFDEEPLKSLPKDSFQYFSFHDNEKNMMSHFLDWWQNNYCDICVGYNSQSFDFGYIVNRIERLFGNPNTVDNREYRYSNKTKRLSPVGKVSARVNNMDNERANKTASLIISIDGMFLADELVFYRDKFKPTGGILDGGFSLHNVGEHEGLGHKTHYRGTKAPNGKIINSLKDLYEQDWNRFAKYNIRDVDLLRRVEEQVKLVPLAIKVASSGLCNYDSIYSSIGYLTGSLTMFSKTKMNRIFTSYKDKNSVKNEKYIGAYVFEPVPGIYKYGIGTCDYNSLYPNTIIYTNISIETYVGILRESWDEEDRDEFTFTIKNADLFKYIIGLQIKDICAKNNLDSKNKDVIKSVILNNGLVRKYTGDIKITRKQINELIDKYCIITKNNTILIKHEFKRGCVAEWCSHFFNLRKNTKKTIAKLEKRLANNEIVGDDNIEKTKIEIENLTNMQQAIKIMINSVYGCLGTAYSSIFSADLAQTVTLQGQCANKTSAKFIKDYFMKNYGVGDDYIHIASGDSDSLFMNLECVTKKFAKDNNISDKMSTWDDASKLKYWDMVEGFVNNVVTPNIQNFMTNYCHTKESHVLRYSLEYIGDVGIYEAKKHYGIHKICLEGGILCDKIAYKGIELKKGNIPIQVKDLLNEVYTGVLKNDWKDNDFRKFIDRAYDKMSKLDITDISYWKGYGTERKSEGFLQMQKHSTSIASACTFYNQLLKQMNINSKYEEIITGEKGVRFCYIKPSNKYGIKYIAFKDGQYPDEFRKIFEVDYDTMFEKLIISTLKNFIVASKFKKYDPRNANMMDIDDL